MRSWRTTVWGLLLAGAHVVMSIHNGEPIDWEIVVGIIGLGAVARDNKVSDEKAKAAP